MPSCVLSHGPLSLSHSEAPGLRTSFGDTEKGAFAAFGGLIRVLEPEKTSGEQNEWERDRDYSTRMRTVEKVYDRSAYEIHYFRRSSREYFVVPPYDK